MKSKKVDRLFIINSKYGVLYVMSTSCKKAFKKTSDYLKQFFTRIDLLGLTK